MNLIDKVFGKFESDHYKYISTINNDSTLDSTMKVVERLQLLNPKLYLAGSIALMASGHLDHRKSNDIDFVMAKDDLKSLQLVKHFSKDSSGPYSNQKHLCIGYSSYHGVSGAYSINILVYDDESDLESETIIYNQKAFKIQKLDDILYWKTKYNRNKDIKDIEQINLKLLEKAFFQEDK